MQKIILVLILSALCLSRKELYGANAAQTANRPAGQTNTSEQNRVRPAAESNPDIQEDNPQFLPPRNTIGLPERNYYIDRAGNYVYYGKPILQGSLNINYSIDGVQYNGVNYSVRYFYTERITDDDIFDNLNTGIDGTNYKGQLLHDFRFLLKGTPYPAIHSERVYLPRTFIRFEIKSPEGLKYIVAPSLNAEITYLLKPEEAAKRAELLINSYSRFRSDIRDIMLYERIRYSAFAWITLKRSRYEMIDRDKIIWHFYSRSILNEQHLTGKLTEIQSLLKRENKQLNTQKVADYFKKNNYLRNAENAEYYVLKFRFNNHLQYIVVPVDKTYHNALNRPNKELITFFARRFSGIQNSSRIIGAKEEPQGVWQFEYLE